MTAEQKQQKINSFQHFYEIAREDYHAYARNEGKKTTEINPVTFMGYKLRARLKKDFGEKGFALYDPQRDTIFNLWFQPNMVVVDILDEKTLGPKESIAHLVTPATVKPNATYPFTFDLFDRKTAYYTATYSDVVETRRYQNGDISAMYHESDVSKVTPSVVKPIISNRVGISDPSISYLLVENPIVTATGTEEGVPYEATYTFDANTTTLIRTMVLQTPDGTKTRTDKFDACSNALIFEREEVINNQKKKTLFSYDNLSVLTNLGEFVFHPIKHQMDISEKVMRVSRYSQDRNLPTSFEYISETDAVISHGKNFYNKKGQKISSIDIESQDVARFLFFKKRENGKIVRTQYENNKYQWHTIVENTPDMKSRVTFVRDKKVRSITLKDGVLTRTRVLPDGTEHKRITKRLKNGDVSYVEMKGNEIIVEGTYFKNGTYHLVSKDKAWGKDKKGLFESVVMKSNAKERHEMRLYKNGTMLIYVYSLHEGKVAIMSQKAYDKKYNAESNKLLEDYSKKLQERMTDSPKRARFARRDFARKKIAETYSAERAQEASKKSRTAFAALTTLLCVGVAFAGYLSIDKVNDGVFDNVPSLKQVNEQLKNGVNALQPKVKKNVEKIKLKIKPLLWEALYFRGQNQKY